MTLYFTMHLEHTQPEIWAPELMKKCFDILNPGGVWVSYCAKGSVRRSLKMQDLIPKDFQGHQERGKC